MRPELAALVDWLRKSGRMAEVDYPPDTNCSGEAACFLLNAPLTVRTPTARACYGLFV
jgi:hypothetical protein